MGQVLLALPMASIVLQLSSLRGLRHLPMLHGFLVGVLLFFGVSGPMLENLRTKRSEATYLTSAAGVSCYVLT